MCLFVDVSTQPKLRAVAPDRSQIRQGHTARGEKDKRGRRRGRKCARLGPNTLQVDLGSAVFRLCGNSHLPQQDGMRP